MFLRLRRSSGFLHRAGNDGVGLGDRVAFVASPLDAAISNYSPERAEDVVVGLVGLTLGVVLAETLAARSLKRSARFCRAWRPSMSALAERSRLAPLSPQG